MTCQNAYKPIDTTYNFTFSMPVLYMSVLFVNIMEVCVLLLKEGAIYLCFY